MSHLRSIIVIVIGLTVFGYVAADFGIAAPFLVAPGVPDAPVDAGILDSVLLPFKYIFNAFYAFWVLMTFQVAGIPATVSVFFTLILTFTVGYIAFRVLRGGG